MIVQKTESQTQDLRVLSSILVESIFLGTFAVDIAVDIAVSSTEIL